MLFIYFLHMNFLKKNVKNIKIPKNRVAFIGMAEKPEKPFKKKMINKST